MAISRKSAAKRDHKMSRLLINSLECPHKKAKEHFHNGRWFVLEENLPPIMAGIAEPKIEEELAWARLCLLCEERRFGVLSFQVERFEEYTRYLTRESVLILPTADYFIRYFEFRVPWDKDKERRVFESIENNAPRNIRERSKYYESELACFDFLKRGGSRLVVNGHFTVCAEHNTADHLDEISRRIVGTVFGEKHGFHFYPWLGNEIINVPDGLDDFLKTHFTGAEIETRIISGQSLVNALDKKNIFLSDFH
ncbi:hypothetical protein A2303_02120 [Candidatus Falkowbacteria bacterium RIFOXYB2_FULL_47_14]|uniref:Uncharacterized protein n=1 Tax=Candidatus Falkowbacteria bacterium RIFOXYA2_FULL_47_19 TaxID=1797994 RepID=A0A1F5SEV3_9BACT|nr:MAG: hypothetical protein A2227_07300 [Candidatus Falkowbacteria bacterium RIFOXYA2_FULL_47_19]OGF35223.1 MAG: hypothetical protein A2468_00925 [Candidatus Falkowbacteria bacterium RIFOXYC2_FULL_46_15]OGF43863.1 MAG: hypothetical protein A2303_02120 [Candidatus Falkowbacteria bacterium RIFOXYB2_FULL_47_14]